ncbi:MAG: thioesterase family protein [Planctomycetota bacterium]
MGETGSTTIRVRYEETDQGGIVHHSRHVVWFETARTEWLRELGKPYLELEKQGIRLLVSEVSVKYHYPAYYDDLVTIECSLLEARGARLKIGYTVTSPRGELVCTGSTTLACLDRDRGRPCRLPQFFLDENFQTMKSSSE